MRVYSPKDVEGRKPAIADIPDLSPEIDLKLPKTDIGWLMEKIKDLEKRVERLEKELKIIR